MRTEHRKTDWRPTRRSVVGVAASSLSIALSRSAVAQTKSFVSTVLGGVFERSYRQGVIEPFFKATGIKVELKLGAPSEWVTNAIVNRRRPEIDLLFLPYPDNVRAVIEGLGLPLSETEIPNLKHVFPPCIDQFRGHGVGMDYLPSAIAYRTDMISKIPNSWADLWDPAYAGKLIIPDINAVGGWEMLMIAARLNGGGENNLDPAFKAIRALKPNVRKFYSSPVDLAQLLDAGEAGIAAIAPSNRVYDLIGAGKPIKFVVPQEGAMLGMVSYHIARQSSHVDLCKQFINFALSKQSQEDFCNGMDCAPSTRYAVLSEKSRQRVLPIEQMILFDWFKVVPQMSALIDRWNREIAA